MPNTDQDSKAGDIKFVGTIGYFYEEQDGSYVWVPMLYSSNHVFDSHDRDIGMAFEFDTDKLYYNFKDKLIHHREF